jgi:hypothetical protein
MAIRSGVVLDDTGTAVNGATVELFTEASPPTSSDSGSASVTTDSNGDWSITSTTRGPLSAKITNGSDIVWLRQRDRVQLARLELWEATANQEALIVTRAEDAASIEVATFEGDRATPAAGDIAYISLKLSDSAGNQDEMARLSWLAIDETTTTEDGALAISTLTGGSLSEKARFDENGTLFINDTTNANMTAGLTLNQGAADDEIIALKSSDVAQPRTGVAEIDTYATLGKADPAGGGLLIRGFLDTNAAAPIALVMSVFSEEAANTAKTTAALGLVDINARLVSGDADADITADGNVFTVRARVGGSIVARLLVDEDGDLYSVTAAQTFDDYDDIALVNAYDGVRAGFEGWAKEHEDELIRLGILGAPVADGGMTNMTQLCRLLTGAVRQLGSRLQAAETQLAALPGPAL